MKPDGRRVAEVEALHNVVGGLGVLEAVAFKMRRHGDEEVVVIVMMAAIEQRGLADERIHVGEEVGLQVEVGGLVGADIEGVGGMNLGGERILAAVIAHEDGRVDELLDGDGLEGSVGGIERGMRVAGGAEGGGRRPNLTGRWMVAVMGMFRTGVLLG